MPARIKHRQQRLIIARAVMDILRIISSRYLGRERFGAHADEAVLCVAVYVGQAEARPMSAAKLAEFCGIPRPTAIRKLQQLADVGMVERLADGAYILPLGALNSNEVLAAYDATVRIFHDTSQALSKMDSKPVAPG